MRIEINLKDTLATKSRCKSTIGKIFFKSLTVSSGNKCCSIPGVINSFATDSIDVKYDFSLDKSSASAWCWSKMVIEERDTLHLYSIMSNEGNQWG